MATIKQITAKHKKIHDEQAAYFYPLERAGLIDAEQQALFTACHLENELAKQAELKTASDYIEPEPVRDLEKEIDNLKAEIEKLKEVKDGT